jgi:hypothetical protein
MAETPLLPPPAERSEADRVAQEAELKAANGAAAAYGKEYKDYCALQADIKRFGDRYDELAAPRSLELVAYEIKVTLAEAYLEGAHKNKKASAEELAVQARRQLAAVGMARLRRSEQIEPLSGEAAFGEEATPEDPDTEDTPLSESDEVLFGKLYRAAARQTHEDTACQEPGEPGIIVEAQLALQGYSAPALYRRLALARRRGNFLETSALSIFIHWATGKSLTLLAQLGLTPAAAADLLHRARASLSTRRERRLRSGIGLLYSAYCTSDGVLSPEWEQRVVSHFQTLIAGQQLRLEYLVQCALDLGLVHRQQMDALLDEVS